MFYAGPDADNDKGCHYRRYVKNSHIVYGSDGCLHHILVREDTLYTKVSTTIGMLQDISDSARMK